jgi:hypothetical protein
MVTYSADLVFAQGRFGLRSKASGWEEGSYDEVITPLREAL